jgi:hypothetical protein
MTGLMSRAFTSARNSLESYAVSPVAAREVEQLAGCDHFVAFARGERDVERTPFRVDERVDLG